MLGYVSSKQQNIFNAPDIADNGLRFMYEVVIYLTIWPETDTVNSAIFQRKKNPYRNLHFKRWQIQSLDLIYS